MRRCTRNMGSQGTWARKGSLREVSSFVFVFMCKRGQSGGRTNELWGVKRSKGKKKKAKGSGLESDSREFGGDDSADLSGADLDCMLEGSDNEEEDLNEVV